MEATKKLGFGLMRLPMENEQIDETQTFEMVDLFLEQGFTYFDTAYVYIGGNSEKIVKKALVERYPRERFQIATKMPIWCVQKQEDLERIYQEQLERTGAGYFDFYLLHSLSEDKLEKLDTMGAWDFIKQKKAEGTAKKIGFSFHDTAPVLERLLKAHPEVDFVQLQINYADWEDETVQSRKCYEVAEKYHKPVIVMEPVKGGSLAVLPPQIREIFHKADDTMSIASWAVRFAASLDNVMMVLSGMSNLEQVADNTSFMKNMKVLAPQEHAVIDAACKALKKIPVIPCTACRYCVEDCPKKINIPTLLNLMNRYHLYGGLEGAKHSYQIETDGIGKAGDCISCKKCMGHCPQHIEIPKRLKEIANTFED